MTAVVPSAAGLPSPAIHAGGSNVCVVRCVFTKCSLVRNLNAAIVALDAVDAFVSMSGTNGAGGCVSRGRVSVRHCAGLCVVSLCAFQNVMDLCLPLAARTLASRHS